MNIRIIFLVFSFGCSMLYGQNIALNKPTIQSSVYGGLTSNIAVDGNTDRNAHTHTGQDQNPFWRVDLEGLYSLNSIKVINRTSTAQWVIDRLIGFKLYVGDVDSTDPADYTEIAVLDGSGEQLFDNLTVNGRYVLVYGANKNEFLSLTEIEVNGVPNVVDNQSPTPPILSSGPLTDTTVQLSWSGATDNTGVTGYKVYSNGNLVATVGFVSNHTLNGLTAATTYNFTVRALDAAGNESPHSNSLSLTTTDSGNGNGSSGVWSKQNTIASYQGEVVVGATSLPIGYKMAVDGKLITEEVKVKMSENWPDYVFYEGYDLPTLVEIQKHIQEKGHLPNIPSAAEVEANGVELGEMDRLLLEKIEELTLYILQQKKRLDEQEKEILELKKMRE